MGKSTISMAIFNSYIKLPEGTSQHGTFGTRFPEIHHIIPLRIQFVSDFFFELTVCHQNRGHSI